MSSEPKHWTQWVAEEMRALGASPELTDADRQHDSGSTHCDGSCLAGPDEPDYTFTITALKEVVRRAKVVN